MGIWPRKMIIPYKQGFDQEKWGSMKLPWNVEILCAWIGIESALISAYWAVEGDWGDDFGSSKPGDRVMRRNDPMASGNASTIWIDAWQPHQFNRSRDRSNPFRYLYYPPAPSLVWDPGPNRPNIWVFFMGRLGTKNPRSGRMPHTSTHTDLHEFQEGALPWRVFKAIRKRNRNYRFVCFVSVGIIKTTQFDLLGLLPQLLPVPIFYLEMKPLGIGHPPSRVLR